MAKAVIPRRCNNIFIESMVVVPVGTTTKSSEKAHNQRKCLTYGLYQLQPEPVDAGKSFGLPAESSRQLQ